MKSIIAIGIILIGFLTSCDAQKTNNSEANGVITKDVTPAEFKELINSNEGILLDVRTPEEVAEAKINGSVNLNIYDSNFEAEINKLDKNKTVYVYCKSGGRSRNAKDLKKTMGFTKIYNLDGGITSWKSEGFETK